MACSVEDTRSDCQIKFCSISPTCQAWLDPTAKWINTTIINITAIINIIAINIDIIAIINIITINILSCWHYAIVVFMVPIDININWVILGN